MSRAAGTTRTMLQAARAMPPQALLTTIGTDFLGKAPQGSLLEVNHWRIFSGEAVNMFEYQTRVRLKHLNNGFVFNSC